MGDNNVHIYSAPDTPLDRTNIFLPKGSYRFANTDGGIDLRKWLKKELKKFHVPVYEDCDTCTIDDSFCVDVKKCITGGQGISYSKVSGVIEVDCTVLLNTCIFPNLPNFLSTDSSNVLHIGSDNKLYVGSTSAIIYPSNLVPFGDGSTPGGITNNNFSYDPNNYFNLQVGTINPNSGFFASTNTAGLYSEDSTSAFTLAFLEMNPTDIQCQFSGVTNTNAGFEINDNGFYLRNFNHQWIFPIADGTANQALITDGAGNLSFSSLVSAPIYPNIYIPYGDGTTSGGITSPNFTFDGTLFHITSGGSGSGWGQIQQIIESSGSEAGISLNNSGVGGQQWNIISTSSASSIGGGMCSIGNATQGINYFNLDATGIITIGQTNNGNSILTINNSSQTLNWYSNDPYFNLDGAVRMFQIGDYTYDWYGTSIKINDDVGVRTITHYANLGHIFTGSYIYADNGLGIDSLNSGNLLTIGATNAATLNYGNSTTTHNFFGSIYNLYESSGIYSGNLRIPITANQIYTFQNASGVLAFLSDIPSLSGYLTTSSAAATYEPIISTGTTSQYWRGDKTWQTLPLIGTWGTLNYPTYVSGTPFVKMTSAGTFALDTNTYLTSSGISGLTTGQLPIAGSATTLTSSIAYSTTPTASTISKWDVNKNLSANNLIDGYATTATAAGTTTLTVGSAGTQYFTGTSTQTVVLPVASTMIVGQCFMFKNLSTGTITIQSSGGNTVQTLTTGQYCTINCILTSGTTAASWDSIFMAAGATVAGSNTQLQVNVSGALGAYSNLIFDGNTLSTTNTWAGVSFSVASGLTVGSSTTGLMKIGGGGIGVYNGGGYSGMEFMSPTGTYSFFNGSWNTGGSTFNFDGAGLSTNGALLNGVRTINTQTNGIAGIDHAATNAGNYYRIRTNNGTPSLTERITIDTGNTCNVNIINSNLNIGGSSNITPNSTLQVTGSIALNYIAKSANYPISATDSTIENTSGANTYTLPTAVGITGRRYTIVNSTASTVTIATTSPQTFVNVATTPTTLTMTTYGSYTVQSNGANWMVIAKV